MIRSKEPRLDYRALENLSWLQDIALGVYQRTWTAEIIEDIIKDPAWFADVIEEYDLDLASSGKYIAGLKLEHSSAYALQRDSRYAYAGRKELMAQGWDSLMEGQYHDGYAGRRLNIEEAS